MLWSLLDWPAYYAARTPERDLGSHMRFGSGSGIHWPLVQVFTGISPSSCPMWCSTFQFRYTKYNISAMTLRLSRPPPSIGIGANATNWSKPKVRGTLRRARTRRRHCPICHRDRTAPAGIADVEGPSARSRVDRTTGRVWPRKRHELGQFLTRRAPGATTRAVWVIARLRSVLMLPGRRRRSGVRTVVAVSWPLTGRRTGRSA